MLNKTVIYEVERPKTVPGVGDTTYTTHRGTLIGVLTEAGVLVGVIEEEGGHLMTVPIDNIRMVR